MVALEQRFASVMEGLKSWETLPRLAVAVSGGSDSMALALLAKNWAGRHGGELVTLTVDHALREASAEEAKTVHYWLTNKGIEHHILCWQHLEKPLANVQAKAREARYKLMAEWCQNHQIPYLLLAHQLEDQVETFWLRLERGSGIDGLMAMAPLMEAYGISFIRPLLSISKEELRGFLLAQGQEWIEDPSNQKDIYTRNRIRQFLMAYEPCTEGVDRQLFFKRIAATAEHLARAHKALEAHVDTLMREAVTWKDTAAVVNKGLFFKAEEEESLRLLARILMRIGKKVYKPRFSSLLKLYHALQGESPAPRSLWGCRILFDEKRQEILFLEEKKADKASTP